MQQEIDILDIPARKIGIISEIQLAVVTMIFGPLCGAYYLGCNLNTCYNKFLFFITLTVFAILASFGAQIIYDNAYNIPSGILLINLLASLLIVILNRLFNSARIEKMLRSEAVYYKIKNLIPTILLYGFLWAAALVYIGHNKFLDNLKYSRYETKLGTYLYEKDIPLQTVFAIKDVIESNYLFNEANKGVAYITQKENDITIKIPVKNIHSNEIDDFLKYLKSEISQRLKGHGIHLMIYNIVETKQY